MNLTTVDEIVQRALKKRIFSGCALGVLKGHEILYERYYGRHFFAPWARRVDENSVFDLASLTKPLCSALLLLIFVSEKKLSLFLELGDIFKNCPEDKKRISIKDILNHTSGLLPWTPLFVLKSKKEYLRRILTGKLIENQEKRAIYSDLGYILLGFILEKVGRDELFSIFKKRILLPLKIKDSSFKKALRDRRLFVSTGFCPYRQRILLGEVNDLNAWGAGGFLGHAGLFLNLKELARMMKPVLSLAIDGDGDVLGIDGSLFLKETSLMPLKKRRFMLGFDTPSGKTPTCGSFFSKKSLGHLGYTGTSFWMDLKDKITVLFLSNRTFPHDYSRNSKRAIRDFRIMLHDTIKEEVSRL